ncbi:hypothetical protein EYF80_039710 [Liparis tanakae]|uniref:Uncharacterized protein n=1 Tax=Liparis tanakae TaxID=230148 RepID=A0A4Z2GBL1_9TELE|nr:hypothetical protein EYF80_039710 [Liparis tanakae]
MLRSTTQHSQQELEERENQNQAAQHGMGSLETETLISTNTPGFGVREGEDEGDGCGCYRQTHHRHVDLERKDKGKRYQHKMNTGRAQRSSKYFCRHGSGPDLTVCFDDMRPSGFADDPGSEDVYFVRADEGTRMELDLSCERDARNNQD